MEIELFLKPYLQIFFVCGIIPYPFKVKTESRHQKCRKVLQFLPLISVIILLFVVVFVWFNFYYINEFRINIGNKNYIISSLFLLNLLLTNVSTIVFGFYYRSLYRSICDSLVNLENVLKISFKKELSFEKISKLIKRKFFLVIFGDLLLSISNISYDSELKNEVYVVATMLLMLTIAYVSCINIIIHIDLITNVFTQFNEWLTTEKKDLSFATVFESKCNDGYEELLDGQFKWIKYFYFALWQHIEKINQHFGWIMMFFLVQMFLEFTFACYWIFMLIEKQWNLWEIARKINHIFFIR